MSDFKTYSVPGGCDLHVPYKRWGNDPQEEQNYEAIEQWSRRLPGCFKTSGGAFAANEYVALHGENVGGVGSGASPLVNIDRHTPSRGMFSNIGGCPIGWLTTEHTVFNSTGVYVVTFQVKASVTGWMASASTTVYVRGAEIYWDATLSDYTSLPITSGANYLFVATGQSMRYAGLYSTPAPGGGPLATNFAEAGASTYNATAADDFVLHCAANFDNATDPVPATLIQFECLVRITFLG